MLCAEYYQLLVKGQFPLYSEYGFLNNKTQVGLETKFHWD